METFLLPFFSYTGPVGHLWFWPQFCISVILRHLLHPGIRSPKQQLHGAYLLRPRKLKQPLLGHEQSTYRVETGRKRQKTGVYHANSWVSGTLIAWLLTVMGCSGSQQGVSSDLCALTGSSVIVGAVAHACLWGQRYQPQLIPTLELMQAVLRLHREEAPILSLSSLHAPKSPQQPPTMVPLAAPGFFWHTLSSAKLNHSSFRLFSLNPSPLPKVCPLKS